MSRIGTPPECSTMKTYGNCVNMDDLCKKDWLTHPLKYYKNKLKWKKKETEKRKAAEDAKKKDEAEKKKDGGAGNEKTGEKAEGDAGEDVIS